MMGSQCASRSSVSPSCLTAREGGVKLSEPPEDVAACKAFICAGNSSCVTNFKGMRSSTGLWLFPEQVYLLRWASFTKDTAKPSLLWSRISCLLSLERTSWFLQKAPQILLWYEPTAPGLHHLAPNLPNLRASSAESRRRLLQGLALRPAFTFSGLKHKAYVGCIAWIRLSTAVFASGIAGYILTGMLESQETKLSLASTCQVFVQITQPNIPLSRASHIAKQSHRIAGRLPTMRPWRGYGYSARVQENEELKTMI